MNILVQVHIMDDFSDEVNAASISLDDKAIKHIFKLSRKAGRDRISEWNYTPEFGCLIDTKDDGCEDKIFEKYPYLSLTESKMAKLFRVVDDFRSHVVELNVDKSDFWWSGNIKHTNIQWETRMIPLSFISVGLKEPAPAKPKADLNISLEDRIKILEKITTGVSSGLNDREIAEVSLKGVSKAQLVACLRNGGSIIH